MAYATNTRPHKLVATGDKLSRDDVATWQHILLGHVRQNEHWQQFLAPAGPHKTWTATDEDETNGLTAAATATMSAPVATAKLQAHFYNFISCIARFSPKGYSNTVLRESTSFKWVVDHINEAYGLDTKGEHFLSLDDIKLEFDANYTFT